MLRRHGTCSMNPHQGAECNYYYPCTHSMMYDMVCRRSQVPQKATKRRPRRKRLKGLLSSCLSTAALVCHRPSIMLLWRGIIPSFLNLLLQVWLASALFQESLRKPCWSVGSFPSRHNPLDMRRGMFDAAADHFFSTVSQ